MSYPKRDMGNAGQKARLNLAGSLAFAIALGSGYALYRQAPPPEPWTDAELRTIGALWLDALPPAPEDPTNAVANDPLAQRFGHRLFFDQRLSANGAVACATCHRPERRFTDGLRLAVGLSLGQFNTPSLVGAAYSPWQFWNGRKDSLWAQAASPLESPIEHGSSRTTVARLIAADANYRTAYETLFGPLPALPVGESAAGAGVMTEVFINAAKVIAAYERLLLPGESRFDRYAASLFRPAGVRPDADQPHQVQDMPSIRIREPEAGKPTANPQQPAQAGSGNGITRMEMEGLRLFIGKAQCINCHNGPLFSNHEFHNTGLLPAPGGLPDLGRIVGVDLVREDPFNCLGPHSDAATADCAELRFQRTGVELLGARKTPSLRNLGGTGPHMHAGQFPSLSEVLDHYNRAPNAIVGHNEAKPLNLLPYELKRLEAFLHTLDAPVAAAPGWLAPP